MSDYLPQELIIEIFTRLPPKTLLQIRCVCKSWRSLISSPSFISTHTHQHPISAHNPRKIVRMYSDEDDKEHYAVRFDNDSFDLDLKSPIKFPFEGICRFYFRIVGCCNGLLCLSDDIFRASNTIILWNPAIRRKVILPNSLVSSRNVSDKCMHVLGFGFDSRMKDFKVVRMTYVKTNCGYCVPPRVDIYTVKGGAWREINSSSPSPLHGIVDYYWSQALVNGAVHWVAYNQVGVHDYCRMIPLIMSFDMNDEVFGEINLPQPLVNESPINMNTLVVGELLSVVQCNRIDAFNPHVSIWVMKEYGVASSWCKFCNYDSGIQLGRALDVRRNGEILMGDYGGEFVSYNPQSKRLLVSSKRGASGSIYADNYTESLALLLEGDEIRDDPSTDTNAISPKKDFLESYVDACEVWIRLNAKKFFITSSLHNAHQ